MRAILFNMPDLVPYIVSKHWRSPSIGLASIAANVDARHDVVVADLVTRRGDDLKGVIVDLLHRRQPDVVGLSAMSFQFATACKVARLVRQTRPRAKIVLGGYHGTLLWDELGTGRDAGLFDCVVRGEGESAFNELLDAYEGRRRLTEVRGVSFACDGVFVHNDPRPLEELSRVRIPARSKRLWHDTVYHGRKVDMVESSRGCTHSCSFCSIRQMYGKSFRTYTIGRVIDDIRDAINWGARIIVFADDNITLDIDRFEALCDAIIRARLNRVEYIIQASTAGMAHSETLAAKMDKAGFALVFLGIENVSQRNLKQMKKTSSKTLAIEAVRLLHRHNILIIGGMIVGHPEDNEDDVMENFEFFREQDIDLIGDQVMTPYPKTGIREELDRMGLITNKDDYRFYNGAWANVRTRHLSSDELQYLKWRCDKRYLRYFTPSTAFRTRYPLAFLARLAALIPARRAAELARSARETTRQTFRREMNEYRQLNAHLI